ncbi:hypothetical protein BC936DRAFT_137204 [Jimgerdemannia flammicorona]|uniref:Alpha-1,3-glucosyltransferase n=1 Tax=Jimgerdemannia flammicorona TaxID=994334 RepID=A0A433CXV5_9FUNG|nr:hypothetical protein BC936DRAFT_137204 [Jimgerdemannia flammicorona]
MYIPVKGPHSFHCTCSLMATNSRESLKIFVILSVAGIFSLYPLLFNVAGELLELNYIFDLPTLSSSDMSYVYALCHILAETPIKFIISMVWMSVVCAGLSNSMDIPLHTLLSPLETIYLAGFILLQIYVSVVHILVFGSERFEFLPLMMTSLYCAVGVCYGWLRFTVAYILGWV